MNDISQWHEGGQTKSTFWMGNPFVHSMKIIQIEKKGNPSIVPKNFTIVDIY